MSAPSKDDVRDHCLTTAMISKVVLSAHLDLKSKIRAPFSCFIFKSGIILSCKAFLYER